MESQKVNVIRSSLLPLYESDMNEHVKRIMKRVEYETDEMMYEDVLESVIRDAYLSGVYAYTMRGIH